MVSVHLNALIDEPEKFANAPVGLQVVGRCQEEEAVIAITEIVADALEKQKHSHGGRL